MNMELQNPGVANLKLIDRISGKESSGIRLNQNNRVKASLRSKKGKERALQDDTIGDNYGRIHTPWYENLDIPIGCTRETALHYELIAFRKYITPVAQETEARKLVIDHITSLIRSRWPKVIVDLFGSTATNLTLPDGDIDLVLTFPYEIDQKQKKSILFQLAALLKKAEITDKTNVISHARVPIVTFTTRERYGSFNLDISLAEGAKFNDGVKAVSIVKRYLNEMPALYTLIVVIKAILSQRSLNDAANGSLSSYSVICMCISFLQLNPARRDMMDLRHPDKKMTFGVILMDFLKYYGHDFPYTSAVISVQAGRLLDKVEKDWVIQQRPSALSVQCLVDADKDTSRGCGKIEKIKQCFLEIHKSIQNTKITFPFTSILGNAIKITQNELDYRKHLCNIVDSGSLLAAIRQREPFDGSYPNYRDQVPNLFQRPRRIEKPLSKQNDQIGQSAYRSDELRLLSDRRKPAYSRPKPRPYER